MATSNSYTFSVSRDDIIRDALQNLRKLDEIEGPTPQETLDCSRKLNMMVKQWQGKADFAPGLKTWTRKHGHLFLSSSTGQYSIGPGATGWTNSYVTTKTTAGVATNGTVIPVASVTGISIGDKFALQLSNGSLYWGVVLNVVSLNVTLTAGIPSAANTGAVVFDYTTAAQQPVAIESAFLRDIYNQDVPLRIMQQGEYDLLPSKTDITSASDPTAIYYEFLLVNSTLYTDVAAAQDVTKHICITYMEASQDFVNPLDTPYFPQEWYLPLCLGLSKLMAPSYGAMWTPVLEDNFKMALAIAQRKEPEVVNMWFQPGEDGQ
jgi:hypothetical protein